MCLCSLSSGRIERSVSGPQEWRGTWDVGCCKHLQGHTTHSHCVCEDISRAKGSHHWEKRGDKMVALYRIVRLRSFSWLLFCSARNWLRWRPALTRTQNFSWYVFISSVYAVTLFVLFHQTGYWMVFNWSSLCSNWQTELQILYPRERLFCLFLLFSFWN